MPTFARTQLGLPIDQVFLVQSVSVALMTFVIPLAGLVSDLWNRRTVLMIGTLGVGILVCPLMAWVASEPSIMRLLVMQLTLCFFIGISYGPVPAALAEQFPTRVRSTGIAVSYNIAVMIFGGFAPYMVTHLVDYTGTPVAAGGYVLVTALVGVAAFVYMREGSGAALLRYQNRGDT